MVSDPAGIKKVLVDHADNYPKTEFEREAFAAMFGAGLLGLDGEIWRSHRRHLAPAFHPAAVQSYSETIVATARAFGDRWNESLGETVDVVSEMARLTRQILVRMIFGADGDRIALLVADMAASRQALRRAIDELVAKRLKVPPLAQSDVLGRLVRACDGVKRHLGTAELCDELMALLVAGNETIASAMAWIWYVLALHPQCDDVLKDELGRVLGGRPPSYDDLQHLTYARQVVEETLRLYPPASALAARHCLRDDEIAGCAIPAGAFVAISPFVVHRHRLLWKQPDAFDPNRFVQRTGGSPRFAYLPFGAGPRSCIGGVLAMTELVAILAVLAQTYRLRLAPGARVGFRQRMTLGPRNLLMVVERR